MNAEIKEAGKLSNESWRAKFYGLVREGNKYRVSNSAVRHSAWILGVGILILQVYSAFRPSFKRTNDLMFAPPQVRSDISSIYVPGPLSAKREAEREKRRGLNAQNSRAIPIIERIRPVRLSENMGIPPGSEVMGQLASAGANGMVKVQTLEAVRFDGEALLPKGSVLLGRGTSSDDRLYITFRRAILPDKSELKVKAFAYDVKDRVIGLKGNKISDYAFRLAASAGLIFLGGVADGMRDDYSSSPFARRRPTVRDAALNGVSTTTADLSRQTLESMKNSQERVVVDYSSRLIVIFGDIDDDE